MSVIYKKIQQIIGPLLFLKNEHDVQYGEIVKIKTEDSKIRTGQIVKMSEEMIVVEVFEDTAGISSENAEIIFTEDTFKINISKDMFGQTFNALGNPIDIRTKNIQNSDILTDVQRDINGVPYIIHNSGPTPQENNMLLKWDKNYSPIIYHFRFPKNND